MRHRRGIVLAAVLLVTALTAMVAAGLLFRMSAEVSAGAADRRGEQAYAAAMSGLQEAMAVLRDYGEDPEVWTDNPELFENRLVCDDGAARWYFTCYAAGETDDQIRFGLTDETGKVNVALVGEEILAGLGTLEPEQIDSLLDYVDADRDTRRDGAEQDDYDRLKYPYLIPNGAPGTIDELLLVKGFTARTVFGEDANLNGRLDPNEDDGDESFPDDDGDGRLDRGLRAVATVWSVEPAQGEDGRVDLNEAGGEGALNDVDLPDQTVEFIQLYLAEGNQFAHPSELLEMRYQLKQDHTQEGGRELRTGDWIESGVGSRELPVVMERLKAGATLVGRINVNTAPERVLAALPGMDSSSAGSIVGERRGMDAETKQNLAWLYTEGAVDAETFKKVAPLLVARGWQFHVQVVGFGVPVGRYRVLEAVIDASRARPRIVYLRDITRLGLPMALDALEREL